MARRSPRTTQQAGHFKDARGRKVTLLDPVTMHLLHQHDMIPAETLRELSDEIGVGWSRRIRMVFLISLVCFTLGVLVLVVGAITESR